ncbi:MAG: type IV pilus modification PilV family protein [Pyrinomonadaceae bacterium]|nr:hypothetical protein [Blastocatellia bacterium]MDQ3219742.1 hypothetical protein [Acidobacteriota bacterium]
MLINKSKEKGFSYIDVMIAIVILLVGILAMLSALTTNLVRTYETEQRVIAKQLALSTIESIISAKEIKGPGINGWDSMRNTAGLPAGEDGIFLTGYNPVRVESGSDGVAGTIDDACSGTGSCINPLSGAVNASPLVERYQREIAISDVPDPERPSPEHAIARRRVDVNIRFFVNQLVREETVSTIIANYNQDN